MLRLEILKSEVKSQLTKINTNKATGTGQIVIEMLSAINDIGIDKFTEILNEIYDNVIVLPGRPE